MVLKVVILTVILVALAFLAIGIKMFFIKGGQFTKKCSSVDLSTGEKLGCTCEKKPDTECENYEKHHGTEQS